MVKKSSVDVDEGLTSKVVVTESDDDDRRFAVAADPQDAGRMRPSLDYMVESEVLGLVDFG